MARFFAIRRLLISLFFIALCSLAEAHSGKARFHVIIDTDGAADDLRAICMLLGNREIEVLAITTSEGALTPGIAAVKVKSLLHHFYHEGIPVAAGRNLNVTPPLWRQQSELIDWGDPSGIAVPKQTAKDLIIETIENEDEKVLFICLGTLTNLSDVLAAKPQLKDRIDKIVWYNNSANPLSGANYDNDRASADKVLAIDIPVEMISAGKNNVIPIDEQYIQAISKVNNVYAKRIVETHNTGTLRPVVASKHMKAWDDLTVAWLFAPELFTTTEAGKNITLCSLSGADAATKIPATITQILAGKPDRENRVFYQFPEDPSFYAADIAVVMKDIIARHGHSEWRAGVLTNELHGHLGIYASVGVKMGLRAREYFNIGVDDIVVVSFAGSRPPISCMNDGLQVSTGGTIGHGLISVAAVEPIRPEATFTFKGKTIRLKLKQQYAAQIRNDVMEGIRLHGNLTEAYWLHIRSLAIKYWLEFDRHQIFELYADTESK